MSVGTGMVDNLATLSTLDEHSLVEELRARCGHGNIYTYIGDILIAMNPYTPIPIYDRMHMMMYTELKLQSSAPPHIFAIADKAYQNMRRTNTNQCCVVSGESGAGKTESTKFLVQHIAHLCNYTSGNLQEKILQVNPLLEAFGNAMTVMNDNSSRFGKYIELQFGIDGSLLGVRIFEYLLESTRVLSHGEGESNFHMFYYMFAGLYEKQLQDNLLNSPDDHRILQTADGSPVFDNPHEFEYYQQMWDTLRQTMDIVGFTSEDVDGILAILAAILHISDISFEADDETDGVCIPNEDPLEMAALLLAVPADSLATALISKVTHLRGEEIVTLKDLVAANDGRDALAKTLYSRLFGWIVRQINVILQPDTKRHMAGPSIGILDMAGFENFETNSFEQLCINATNEQLQYYFNQQVFQWELDEYRREGIKAKDVKYTENRPLVDLFLDNPIGFFSLLDEESRFPKASDMTLLEKLSKNLTKKQLFQRAKGNAPYFTINHYAGPVTYDVRSFLEKNRDTLSWNLLGLMKDSDSQFVSDLFNASITDTGSLHINANAPKRSRRSILLCKAPELSGNGAKSLSKQAGRRLKARANQTQGTPIYENAVRTQGAKFKNSLTDLMGKLLEAGPHFVRCIKPNASKQPGIFQTKLVLTQLRYTGIMETIRIRRQGYATRLPFQIFFSRYRFIAFKMISRVDPSVSNCTKIMKKAGMKDYEIGKSKIFLKYYHVERLHLTLDKLLWSIVKCQSVARGYIDRRSVRWLRKASMQDNADLRAFLGHVSRDMDDLYCALTHQESHDTKRHRSMIQERMTVAAQHARQAQVVLHRSPDSPQPQPYAPPVSPKPIGAPQDAYVPRGPKKNIYQATPILLGNPVTGNPIPAGYVEYTSVAKLHPENYSRGEVRADPSRMEQRLGDPSLYYGPDNGQYPRNEQRVPPPTAPKLGVRRSQLLASTENEYPTESMVRPSAPSNYDYDNSTHYPNQGGVAPAPVLQQASQQFMEVLLTDAVENWPAEDYWLKVLCIERSQVVANVNIGGSELIIDDSKQASDSNVIGMRAFSNAHREPATEKVLKKIGKGVKITQDYEGNILAKQLSKTDIIMKGYLHPLDGCLSSEVTEKQGRLSKHPVKIFDMNKFRNHVSMELRNTVIDQRRLMRLCMVSFSFVRNVFDDLETPSWVCLINYVALRSLGTDQMLVEVKDTSNIRLTETEDAQLRRNWQQIRCGPGSYGGQTSSSQDQFDGVQPSEPDTAWRSFNNGMPRPRRIQDNTDSSRRPRSNSPGYAESIPYVKYEGQPKKEKRKEWAKLAKKREDY